MGIQQQDDGADGPVGAAPSEAAPSLQRGQNVGRFVVLGLVGRGGMGEVYAAYDPELERKVAVKLLRARRSRRTDATEGRTRLLREAQAIARLSHPNVVVVYDVGAVEAGVFIAMEFLEGHTVGGWLLSGRRSWRDVLKVFGAAGRGLAAAHDAGLMHRDFKPDNVMVVKDGQVRVMDFGLARQVLSANEVTISTEEAVARAAETLESLSSDGEEDLDSTVQLNNAASPGAGARSRPAAPAGGAANGTFLRAKLTQTGATVGTPAYMAPEQFLGGRTDARTDQFSFCVALYEALYGERPFAGENVAALRSSVVLGELRPPPAQTRVPVWIRRVLARGLRTDPEQRYPSMHALLAALENDPAVRRRKWLAVAAGAAAMLAMALGARHFGAAPPTMCAAGGAHLSGIWEPAGIESPRKQTIRQAFARSGKGYAQQAFTAVARLLDQYTGRWVAMYGEACEATHLRGEQSAEVLDLRMACLRDRLGSVRALTDVFAQAGPAPTQATVVENAVTAAGALPSLEVCADVKQLKAVLRPPDDPAKRKRVEALSDETARVNALRDAGQCAAAKAKASALVAETRDTGYLPLIADALNAVGEMGNDCMDGSESVQRLREAFAAALESHHDRAAARAAVVLVEMAQNRLFNTALAGEWLPIAKAALRRIGGDAAMDAWLANAEGLLLAAQGKGDAAVESMRRSLEIRRKNLGPDHPDSLAAVCNLGVALQEAHRFEEALEATRRAQVDWSRVIGPEHPRNGIMFNNAGEILNELHRFAEARAAFQAAIDVWRRTRTDAFLMAFPLTGLGIAAVEEKRFPEAIAALEEAYAIRVERKVDPGHMGEVEYALARALWSRPGDRARARRLAREAREHYAAAAKEHPLLPAIDDWLHAHAAS